MRYLLFLLLLVPTAHAADVNGYTAKYECYAGGPNCNVDVVSLGNRACDQTITTATTPTSDWTAINWSNNTICIDKGDHTGRGVLTLGSSGTSGTRKVLRYYRSGDTDDDPWDQSGANQAKMSYLDMGGRSYWIVHRLSFPGPYSSPGTVYSDGVSANNIFNRLLVEGSTFNASEGAVWFDGSSSGTFQNSVVRSCTPHAGTSPSAIQFGDGQIRIVNNEVYNCTIGIWSWETGTAHDAVVENNDAYITNAMYTDCSGNYTTSGSCAAAEDGTIATKSGGSSSAPYQIIHNRLWGMRPTDTNVAADGGGTVGSQVVLDSTSTGNTSYILFVNNILSDAEDGINWYRVAPSSTTNQSIIGNIIYHMRAYRNNTHGFNFAGGDENHHEIYLNTFIDISGTYGAYVDPHWAEFGSITYGDIRCNTIIDSAGATGYTGTGTQIDYNTYYGTTSSGETNKLGNYTLNTRANSTAYSLGAIIRTSANPYTDCTAAADTDCFLYKVTTAGTSAGSNQGYTTTLGGTTTDGTMVVKAIRGPYSFYRKLRTTAELVYIPYAKVHNSAPEYQQCTTANMGSALGSRTGIGIDNQDIF